MLYNNETLQAFCFDNNINLLEDYSQIKINRDYYKKGTIVLKHLIKILDNL
jgi:hypothetical protein